MSTHKEVTARAHPNLALVKYWGKREGRLNLPTNGSISVNLDGLTTTTTVRFDPALEADAVSIGGRPADAVAHDRVRAQLDLVRDLAGIATCAEVVSHNDFAAGTGMASSASAFAALSLAASRAAGLELEPRVLSALARRGSGSACRSIPSGFAEWLPGHDHETSYAVEVAPPTHWDLRVVSVVLDQRHKEISSNAGHQAAVSSPLFEARLAGLGETLDTVRRAILERDIRTLVHAAEREAVSMHAIAMTSRVHDQPALSGVYYWQPATLDLVHRVQAWRRQGLDVGFTIDAGANVHLLCLAAELPALRRELAGVVAADSTIVSRPGRGAWIEPSA